MKFSLIHPSRHRPSWCFDTMEKWLSRSTFNDLEYIISLDYDDEMLTYYKQEYLDHARDIKMLYAENKCCVDAVNYAAKYAVGDILIVVSDDFNDPPQDWDRFILEAVKEKTDWILKTQDGQQPWIITLPIMDRIYYNRFGYIYHPEYEHMYADTDMTSVAEYLGLKITSNLRIPHNHYSVTGKVDDVTIKANATYPHGYLVYKKRFLENFGIPISEIKGMITEHSHLHWLQQNGLKQPEI